MNHYRLREIIGSVNFIGEFTQQNITYWIAREYDRVYPYNDSLTNLELAKESASYIFYTEYN